MSPTRSRNDALDRSSRRTEQVRAAQIRLLYENAGTGIAVTTVAAPILAYFQSPFVEPWITVSWLVYMLLVSVARFILSRLYRRASPGAVQTSPWSVAFAIGAGLAGAGWGATGILLYPEAQLMNQMFLFFVLGGMMLGGASLLASRPEAFLAFLLPAGTVPALRLVFDGDTGHVAMGMLALLFTISLLITTWRFYAAITSSLSLQFENQDLVHDLQIATERTEALNQQLEIRVQLRTAELEETTIRLRDEIKQRESTEQELLRVRNLESLGTLAGGIAHDFNNFLTVVQGNIEMAKLQLSPDAPVQDVLDQTASACQRGAFLASQLLTFATGGAPIRRVVSVAKLVLDAVHLARAGAQISIGVDIAGDLWAAELDAGQIGQALHNILLNAKQSMPEGGIVEVRAENIAPSVAKTGGAGSVRISIRDYGAGIPANVLPRIFDPYFTTKTGSSGLGLTTAYAIVSRHGGHLSVHSKAGEGSVCVVELPASAERPAAESAIGPRIRRGAGRLLVMDDEEAMRKLLYRVLTRLGYEVETARDGAEAIALYEAARESGQDFDAVLLDLTVKGGMGGVETAARLREMDPSAKLVVSSGYSDAPVMSQFRDYGFDAVIPKPWTTAQLSELFQKLLGRQPDRKPGPTRATRLENPD